MKQYVPTFEHFIAENYQMVKIGDTYNVLNKYPAVATVNKNALRYLSSKKGLVFLKSIVKDVQTARNNGLFNIQRHGVDIDSEGNRIVFNPPKSKSVILTFEHDNIDEGFVRALSQMIIDGDSGKIQ